MYDLFIRTHFKQQVSIHSLFQCFHTASRFIQNLFLKIYDQGYHQIFILEHTHVQFSLFIHLLNY